MRKKQVENKLNMFTPTISIISSNEAQPNQNKMCFSRSKTPFYRKKNDFNLYNSDEENISLNTLNKSINNQTFIYNSINFNNQNLFNNINNSKNINNHKRRKSVGNTYMVNNVNDGILNFFETMKKSRSISKQKNTKFINIINKLNNTLSFCKAMNKHKTKSFSKQKNNSFKNDRKKIENIINFNKAPSYINNSNSNTFIRRNKRKLMTTNYNINENVNILNMLNNDNKIDNLIMTNNSKVKKVKKNGNNKSPNINKINYISNIKKFHECPNDRNDLNLNLPIEEHNISMTEEERNIIEQIKLLIYKLLNYCSSPKKVILKELENIYRNICDLYNINEKDKNDSKKITTNNPFNNNMKRINKKVKNKNIIENEINILNKKYNQIKEENINLKYLITEKTTAFEDVKNSLKNFQNEINKLKNNNNNINLKNKNFYNNIDNNNNIINVNSKGLEIKNIKLNSSNIKRVNEIQDISSEKSNQKENNKKCNIFNCNNYSFGQNNSFEIDCENSNRSKINNFNSFGSIDPLSLTFHEPISNNENNTRRMDIGQELAFKNYDFSPSLRKTTEALIQTGTMPNKKEKN